MDEALVDYCPVGASESLQSFAHGLHSYPLFVSIRKKGIYSRRSQHLVYVHEQKRMPFAQCVSDRNQSAYTIPVGKESDIRLLPAARSSNPDYILPSELLACKSPPNIVFVKKSFVTSSKGEGSGTVVLREGTLLFPKEIKHKKKATVSLLAVTEKEQEIAIDLKCTGRFSVLFGPDFDLLHILNTYKGSVKLPMEVVVCRRDTTEPEAVVQLQGVGEDWALCGIMTEELGGEKEKGHFRYKAELLANLPYTVQKMVPRDSNSQTVMRLKADYEKAVSGRGDEAIYYDEPALDIYETIDAALTSNPAYTSCDEGAAAVSGNNTKYINLSSVNQGGTCQVPRPHARDRAASYSEISSTKSAGNMTLPAVGTSKSPPKVHPESSHKHQLVNTGSAPPKLYPSKAPMKMQFAEGTPFKELPKEQHPELDALSDGHTSPDKNVAFLRSLDIDMVQWLLSAMNLSQHRERFRAEHVDGEILASCDAECLKELGVTSRIQQIRLAKLIDGTHSAVVLLNK